MVCSNLPRKQRVRRSRAERVERVSLAENYVTTNAGSYPLLQPGHLTVSAATSGSDVFVVTVNYDASDNLIYTLPFVPAPPSTIIRSAAIPFGGF